MAAVSSKRPPRPKLHVPTGGSHICLPGEVVLEVPAGAMVTIGAGLKVKSMPSLASSSSSASAAAAASSANAESKERKRPRDLLADDDEDEGTKQDTEQQQAPNPTAPSSSASDSAVIVAAVMGPVMVDKTAQGVTRYFIPTPTAKRYQPRKGDAVVGAIVRVTPHMYHVNFGAPHLGLLSTVAFDGATKNNRPKLRPGDVIYCQVVSCEPDLDVELSCCAPAGMTAKDWVTGESFFGPVVGGTIVNLPLHTCGLLYTNSAPVLAELGERLAYEACIGLNGKVWLKASGSCDEVVMNNTIALKRILLEAANDDTEQLRATIESLFPATAAPSGGPQYTTGVEGGGDDILDGDAAFLADMAQQQ